MILILGGAFQGKLDFARQHFGFKDADIYICRDADPDFSKPCIAHLEEFVYHSLRNGADPLELLMENRQLISNTVIICEDIFCGVVPMERELRLWRDATGKICQYLSRESEEVYRIFCGLEQKLK